MVQIVDVSIFGILTYARDHVNSTLFLPLMCTIGRCYVSGSALASSYHVQRVHLRVKRAEVVGTRDLLEREVEGRSS